LYTLTRRPLNPAEVAQLITACAAPREKLVILALVETGLRASELSRLEDQDVNWEEGALRLAGRQDPLPVSQVVLGLLRDEFHTEKRLRLGVRQIQRIVRAVVRKAGLSPKVTPDALQRTWLETAGPAETRLGRPRERLLEAAADAALDIVLIADDQRRFVDLNRAAAEVLGLPREKIIGRRIEDFFSEAQGKAVPAAWSAFMVEGEQAGFCQLRSAGAARNFEYRAKAHFKTGFHVSVLREIRRVSQRNSAALPSGERSQE
jgi:PAS domain S-box-containing protein